MEERVSHHVRWTAVLYRVCRSQRLFLLAALIVTHSTFASSVYTPSVVEVSKHFHVSVEAATLPLTLYVLGLGFGPIISAPLSETFGRKIVYQTLLPISLLFTLGAGCAHNIGTLLVCRFLAGLIGSGALAIGAGTNSDLNPPLTRGPASAVFLLAPFAGPAFGKSSLSHHKMVISNPWANLADIDRTTCRWLRRPVQKLALVTMDCPHDRIVHHNLWTISTGDIQKDYLETPSKETQH